MGLSGLIAGRVVSQCISSILIGGASFMLLRRRIPVDLKVPLSVLRPMWKELVHFSFHLNLASIAKSLGQKLDTIIIGALLNPSAVAAYKVVGQLGKAVYLISDPLMTAAYPRFVKLTSHGDVPGLNRLAVRASILVGLVLLPALIVSTFFHKQIIVAFAGAQYVSVSWLLPLFMWSNALAIVLFWTHPYLLSIGLPQYSSLANVVGRLAGVIVFALLVAFNSLSGAAIGSGLPGSFTVLVGVWLIWYFRRRPQPNRSMNAGATPLRASTTPEPALPGPNAN
jgi:O-antigen/teichoic acid export membrane protein